jgi:protein TonB
MAYAHAQRSWNPHRFFGFFVALAINVLLLYGLASALVFDAPLREHDVIDVFVPEEAVKPLPRPESPADWRPDRVSMDPVGPPPEISIQYPPEPVFTGSMDMGTGSTGQTGSGPIVTALTIDATSFVPPIYPPRSGALEEEGTVHLLIYVTPDGRVGDVRVAKSSGFPRLDNSAVKTARTKWRFRPRTQDGMPVAGWGTYAVRFELR